MLVNVKSINFRLGQCQVHERFVKVLFVKTKGEGKRDFMRWISLETQVEFINFTRKISWLSPQIQFRNIKKKSPQVQCDLLVCYDATSSPSLSFTHVYSFFIMPPSFQGLVYSLDITIKGFLLT